MIRISRVVVRVLAFGALVLAVLHLAVPVADADPDADDLDGPTALPSTERVSVSTGGAAGDSGSSGPSVSGDGRFVAFSSGASNLVAGDSNGHTDVFVRDRLSGTTERMSVSTGGVQGNAESSSPSISDDGRFVAFQSLASNLVGGDTNYVEDVFVRDRQSGTTERVSVSTGGVQGGSNSGQPSISADGRFVAFSSFASNLAGGDTNGERDVFLRDRLSSTTERVSVSTGGAQSTHRSYSPSISDDGRFVAFYSYASNLVAGDTNSVDDVFVRDRQSGTTERVSISTGGAQGYGYSYAPSISGDGRFVAFDSSSTNLVGGDTNDTRDVFVRDRHSGTTERVSISTGGVEGYDESHSPSISSDGRHVAFESDAWNLVAGDTNSGGDVFVRDRQSGTTERVSISTGGAQGYGYTYSRSISGDGRFVAFSSSASNLVDGDTNGTNDVFIRDRGDGIPVGTGKLRVTTTPAVPAQIIVDGVARDSWGLTWVEFPVGSHEVCFGPVPGFTAPPCEQVEVLEDQITVVDGSYSQRGSLRVLTSPAVPSTITVDGAPANDWGVWTDLDPGTYEVCFGAVANMATPSCQQAVVTAGGYTEITGTFTSSPGAPGPSGHGFLRATTSPAVGSRITIDGQPADSWGLTWLKLAPGDYEVCFEGVLYATAPACESVEILAGAETVLDGGFVTHGFLRVDTSPAVGATITVEGESANAWGVWTSLEPGTYEVCYGPDPAGVLTPPACEDAVVTAGGTTHLTGTYT